MTIENEAGIFSVFVLINLYADFLLSDSFDEFNMESGFFYSRRISAVYAARCTNFPWQGGI